MVNWDSQSNTPPRVRKTDTFIVFYLFVLHFVTCLKTCNFTACFTSLRTSFLFSIIILHVTSSRSCLYLRNIYHFTYTFSHAHIEARPHKHTCIIRTQGMATTRHRSLVGRSGGRGFVRDRPSKKTKTKKNQHTDISNLKRFEQIELQAKLLNYFLGSNKSNINQDMIEPEHAKITHKYAA